MTAPRTWTASPTTSRRPRRCRSCSTPPSRGPRGRPRAARRPLRGQLGELRGRRRARLAVPEDHAGRQGARRRGHRALHRRGGPGPHRGVEDPRRVPAHRGPHRELGHARRGHHHRLPDLPDLHRSGGGPQGRHRDDQRDQAAQGALPAGPDDAGAVEHLVRPQPGRAPGAQLGVPRTSASRPASTPRSSTPRRSCRCRRSTTTPATPRSTWSTTGATRSATPPTRCSTSWASSRASRPRRPRTRGPRSSPPCRCSNASSGASSTANRNGLEADLDAGMEEKDPLEIINDDAAGRHEDRRRAVRRRQDAAAVRARLGRGHEGRGGLPRAAHGGRRQLRQGQDPAGHGQGRRPRHRQEPRRHHPVQQRLRRGQHRHQAADQRHPRGGRGEQGRRHRDVRAAGEVHRGHEGQPAGDERPRGRAEVPGAARRRGADPLLRRERPRRDVPGRRPLRQGRLRGPAPHGHGDVRATAQRTEEEAAKVAERKERRERSQRIAAKREAEAGEDRPAFDPDAISDVARRIEVPQPPFWGTRVVARHPARGVRRAARRARHVLRAVGPARLEGRRRDRPTRSSSRPRAGRGCASGSTGCRPRASSPTPPSSPGTSR